MQTNEIRSLFIDYFSNKEHMIIPSYSLIPDNDPTLLLIGAGMAPLKPYFTGEKKPPHPRLVNCQKCVRTPDIDRVGITGRHGTFFEMLGNFSFGDYFKKEAIAWGWEFITEYLKLPLDRLWITVYEEDDEAYSIWKSEIGIPENRIVRMGKEDNFWEIGAGPCGPCSEIHYDLGPGAGCGKPDCKVECDCDRFLEIWNLVFTQFNRLPSGELVELERKNIDTGAGLERLAIVMQGVNSLFDIDTVRPIIDYMSEKTGTKVEGNLSLRIVAEHLRGITFMISDGVLPSNEGRGYVLRRLLRRAVRHGRLLGMGQPFLFKAVPLVISIMEEAYPDLKEREKLVMQVIEQEEKRFQDTLLQGMEMLDNYLQESPAGKDQDDKAGEYENNNRELIFPGELAFRLHDTFGFPLELTREIVAEKGYSVDEEAFKNALLAQKERGRSALKTSAGVIPDDRWEETKNIATEFSGYEQMEGHSIIKGIWVKGSLADSAEEGSEVDIIIEKTPFYAESGGQVGDTGVIEAGGSTIKVDDTYLNPLGQVVHRGVVTSGRLECKNNTTVDATMKVDCARREAVCRSHSATHILHRALKEILGDHVNQAGSLVVPDRLRLDFTHFSALSEAELERVEDRANDMVMANLPVEIFKASLDEARQMGAMALFGEKYGDEVRVVRMGEYTTELCGGTHLESTGKIGLIRLIREESVGAGLRRIEALTGTGARKAMIEQDKQLRNAARMLKTNPHQLLDRLGALLEENKNLQLEKNELQRKIGTGQAEDLADLAVKVGDVSVLSQQVEAPAIDDLREVVDRLKDKMARTVIVLGAVKDGKVMLVSAVTRDLLPEGYHAGKLVSETARMVGGGGGGRPDMAQAGGKNPEMLSEALGKVTDFIAKIGTEKTIS